MVLGVGRAFQPPSLRTIEGSPVPPPPIDNPGGFWPVGCCQNGGGRVIPGKFRLAEKRGGKRNRPVMRKTQQNCLLQKKCGIPYCSEKEVESAFCCSRKGGIAKFRDGGIAGEERNRPYSGKKNGAEWACFPDRGIAERNPHWRRAEFSSGS